MRRKEGAEAVTRTKAEPHLFRDSRARNLCDKCDRWIGAPEHLPDEKPEITALEQRVLNAETIEEARYWHDLYDKAVAEKERQR